MSLRLKLFLLLAGPLLVVLAVGPGGLAARLAARSAESLEPRARAIEQAFEHLLERASRPADAALGTSVQQAWAERSPSGLEGRLEGVGLLDGRGGYTVWAGTPAEPPAPGTTADGARFAVRVDGARTRLLARAGPDDRGRVALATLVLDSIWDDPSFVDLLEPQLLRGIQLEVEFLDSAAHTARETPRETGAGRSLVTLLSSPDGEPLAVARMADVPLEQLAERLRRSARAWGTAVLLALALVLFDWPGIARGRGGLWIVAAALAAGRGLLLWAWVPGLLLPRALGAPSVYGSESLGGLLASPADLLLTALATYLFCLTARVRLATLAASHPRGAAWIALGLACAAALAGFGLTMSLARNTRLPLLERPAPFVWDAQPVLWLAVVLVLLGASELLARIGSFRRTSGAPTRRGATRLRVALAFLVLATGSSLLVQHLREQLALERLRSEYAPQILEQSERRRVALTAALRQVQEHYRQDGTGADSAVGASIDFQAYRFWVTSELFRGGYKSSLDFYTPPGLRVSHFAFDLPPLLEQVEPPPDAPSSDVRIREEQLVDEPGLAVQKKLLHAAQGVWRGKERLGVVVGHVLDEPENLPFLPWSRPYLAALGPGPPVGGGEELGSGPEYVLYEPDGAVALTTLSQPPPRTEELRCAGGTTVAVAAGGQSYVGLTLEGPGQRLSLLLVPVRGWLERLAATIRLILFGLAILTVLVLGHEIATGTGPPDLVRALAGSFYRKLLTALLLASVLPLVGLAVFVRGSIAQRGDAVTNNSATRIVRSVQRVVEDYSAVQIEDLGAHAGLDDEILYWLRRVVGQEIHVYENGLLEASSKRELFDSGLLLPRLDGDVRRRLVDEGLPNVVVPSRIGPSTIRVAYAPVRLAGDPEVERVVAVPVVLEQEQIARGISRLSEMILLATVALVCLLAVTAALVARTVARPVRELVEATGRIAAGDYATRLAPRTRDEVAELVSGFNAMASALGRQRADLERRRDYMETLLRHATTGVLSLDSAGRLVTLNPAAAGLLSPDLAAAVAGDALATELERSAELGPLVRALASPAALRGEPVDVDLVRAGEPRRLRVVRVELSDSTGASFGTLILLDDVTDLMRSNQLAAWAEMARAIAHEIKNPLTPIQLSAEHLRRLLRDQGQGPTPEMEACLDTIIKQVRALHAIAGEFSAYAKLPALAPRPTDPVAFMRATLAPYRASRPENVVIEERYAPSPEVAIDAKVLARALINLVENALQAMPDGGRLTLEVAPQEETGLVLLSVGDDGPGIEPSVRARLFEPYFSTKSSGTGLGLAIARRAVEAHQGTIEVDSAPGRGTTFRIRLRALRAE